MRAVVAGTACCAVSAVGYTASNACMRQLHELNVDPMWAVCNKEVVTVAVVGPWIIWQILRGRTMRVPLSTLAVLAVVGLAVQMGANLGLQWAFGVVGLAVAIPAVFSALITGSGLLGWALLGERVSARSIRAIGLLLVSLVLLGIAAHFAGKEVADGGGPLWFTLGVGAACAAGTIFAILTITIRSNVTRATPMSAVVFITTLMGVITLGPLSAWRLGADRLLATTPEQAAWMLAAGTLNLIAFLAIAKGLQLTTVVHANVLNASQVAMAAVAGLLFFSEPLTVWLALGTLLTIIGVATIDRPEEADLHADLHA
jgi:drug/metabolite transporter, DME family